MRPGFGRAALLALGLLTGGCAHGSASERHAGAEVVTVRVAYNNAHVLRTAGRTVLIDAGTEAEAPALDRRLREAGVDPAALAAVILTHGHADHAGGARWFRDRYGVPVIAGAGDLEMLAAGHNDALCPTDRQGRKRLAANQAAEFGPVVVDHPISATTDLRELVGIEATVVPVPGHTDGSLIVLAGELAFVGDLFRGSIVGEAAERHFYMCDLADNDADIEALLTELAPEASRFFVGHFGPVGRAAVERRWPDAR